MPRPSVYLRPTTLAEAAEQAARPNTLVVNGGALLLAQLDLPYDTVVDLQALDDLRRIEARPDGLHLGGGASLQAVIESPLTSDWLKRALRRTLPINHRHATSIGDSLRAAPPLREWLAALIVIQARLVYAVKEPGAPLTRSEQPVDEWAASLHRHDRLHQGILLSLIVPPLPERTGLGAAVVARTPADDPIVNAAAALTLRGDGAIAHAVVAIGGATAAPVTRFELDALTGAPPDDAAFVRAGAEIASRVRPVPDYRGSAEYRAAMAALMTRRALAECCEQLTVSGLI